MPVEGDTLSTTEAATAVLYLTSSTNTAKEEEEEKQTTQQLSSTYTAAVQVPGDSQERADTLVVLSGTGDDDGTAEKRTGVVHKTGSLMLPTFLGIGPAKTGSTALFELLRPLRGVRIGENYERKNAKAQRAKGTFFAEIGFFIDTKRYDTAFGKKGKGLKYYASFFEVETRPPFPSEQIVAIGEKTPLYAGYLMAPYRVRERLGTDVNLVYTVRDPVDAVVSLFIYHKCCVRDKVSFRLTCENKCSVTFVAHTQSLIREHAAKRKCANQRDLDMDSSNSSLKQATNDDQRLLKECQLKVSTRLGPQLTDYFLATNLRRWIHVAGGGNFMCIHSLDIAHYPRHAQRLVANFVGAPDPNDDEELLTSNKDAGMGAHARAVVRGGDGAQTSNIQRLLDTRGAVGKAETTAQVADVLGRLAAIYEGESVADAWKVCQRSPYSVVRDPGAAQEAGVDPAPGDWEWRTTSMYH